MSARTVRRPLLVRIQRIRVEVTRLDIRWGSLCRARLDPARFVSLTDHRTHRTLTGRDGRPVHVTETAEHLIVLLHLHTTPEGGAET